MRLLRGLGRRVSVRRFEVDVDCFPRGVAWCWEFVVLCEGLMCDYGTEKGVFGRVCMWDGVNSLLKGSLQLSCVLFLISSLWRPRATVRWRRLPLSYGERAIWLGLLLKLSFLPISPLAKIDG